MVSVGSELPGVVAVGQQATGIVAVGQLGQIRREPWDRPPRWPAWRRAVAVAGLVALAAVWWFTAGQPLVAVLA